ncbi:vitamin K epoxide reductase family protein [Mycobacterium sp. CSUR Q5927]|nr:vitamin K epoxide reductase family protein [Mycolicibacter sinensis]MDD7813881.1 vitamin K epoxide reductase family protein [Mycobacterium sp. CSUR Q5927]
MAAPAVDPAATPASQAPAAPRAWAVLIAGVIGLAASVTLTVEKIRLLTDASYIPSCNLNPVLSCGPVMGTPQASVLGFPNPLMGIVAFTVVVVTGVLAVTKVSLPRWYWVGMVAGTLVGAGFVHWLIFQSLYRIGALCPYCMVVWAVTMVLLVIFAGIASDEDRGISGLLHRWRWTFAALWFIAVFLLVFLRFQDYWLTLT